MSNLQNKKVAILVANGFEQIEMTSPKDALEQKGVQTHIISPEKDQVKGWDEKDWGQSFKVDKPLSQAKAVDYDALLLPGGVMNPDHLKENPEAVAFVKAFFEAGKPIAAICHAPSLLVETGAIKGRTLTSYPSIKTDLKNAGAEWIDREVVVDNGLVTSRNPDDLPAFNRKMIEEFAEGIHEGQKTLR